MKKKFVPEDHAEGAECSICMIEYEGNDTITQLPCDTRHEFHHDCISNWLKKNNSCPLCKKPITMDDLKNQKKKKTKKNNKK